jgi:hypothetical protein
MTRTLMSRVAARRKLRRLLQQLLWPSRRVAPHSTLLPVG